MPEFYERRKPMTISDKIQLLGIAISALTSIIAIIISVHTLRQNSKMIEDSSRPYIGIYGLSTYICDRYYYIIIKNFGQSIAHIESLTYDFDLAELSLHDGFDPCQILFWHSQLRRRN